MYMPGWIWDLCVNDSIRPWYPEAPAEGIVLECGTGGVRVGMGALCVCPSMCMCVRQGRRGGGGLGQIVHGAQPSGRGWMKLFPGPCPSVTVAAAVTKVLPWQGGHKKAWRGNGSRGQEWGSGGQGSQPAGQHTRGGQGEKRRREGLVFFLFFALSSPGFCLGGRRPKSGHHWTLTLNWGGEMKKGGGL